MTPVIIPSSYIKIHDDSENINADIDACIEHVNRILTASNTIFPYAVHDAVHQCKRTIYPMLQILFQGVTSNNFAIYSCAHEFAKVGYFVQINTRTGPDGIADLRISLAPRECRYDRDFLPDYVHVGVNGSEESIAIAAIVGKYDYIPESGYMVTSGNDLIGLSNAGIITDYAYHVCRNHLASGIKSLKLLHLRDVNRAIRSGEFTRVVVIARNARAAEEAGRHFPKTFVEVLDLSPGHPIYDQLPDYEEVLSK